jgi:hypothetical protein
MLTVTTCYYSSYSTENPCVDSSILSWPTIRIKGLANIRLTPFSIPSSLCRYFAAFGNSKPPFPSQWLLWEDFGDHRAAA